MNYSRLGGKVQREGALAMLLQELFSTEELSRLVVNTFGDRVHASIAWDRPRATVVCDVVRCLSQRGHVAQLFGILYRERKLRRADIDPVAELWLRSMSPPSVSASPGTAYSKDAWSPGGRVGLRSKGALLFTAFAAVAGSLAVLCTTTSGEAPRETIPAERPSSGQDEEPNAEAGRRSSGSRERRDCCMTCGATSKACGDSCIALDKQCHKGPGGCACS